MKGKYSMINKEKLTNWLRENHPELSWSRTGGDGPQKRDDANYINRSEAYEIRDLIYSYYTHCSLGFTDKNFEKTKKVLWVSEMSLWKYGTADKNQTVWVVNDIFLNAMIKKASDIHIEVQ